MRAKVRYYKSLWNISPLRTWNKEQLSPKSVSQAAGQRGWCQAALGWAQLSGTVGPVVLRAICELKETLKEREREEKKRLLTCWKPVGYMCWCSASGHPKLSAPVIINSGGRNLVFLINIQGNPRSAQGPQHPPSSFLFLIFPNLSWPLTHTLTNTHRHTHTSAPSVSCNLLAFSWKKLGRTDIFSTFFCATANFLRHLSHVNRLQTSMPASYKDPLPRWALEVLVVSSKSLLKCVCI